MTVSKSISPELLKTIRELNQLDSIKKYSFALGGGTNLALRYKHRVSKDIDLFCPNLIGFKINKWKKN